MMDQTVTLYRRRPTQPVSWTREVLSGVLLREAVGTALSPQGVRSGQAESLLMIPGHGAAPSPGDGVFPGVGPEVEGAGDIREALPGCRIVTGVTGRHYGSSLDHWEVTLR